jgi:hypothetical protein
MPSRAALRAADADREHVAERLRSAAAEGRLLTDELEQRLEAAFSARTYGQLDVVLADLPGGRVPVPRRRRSGVGLAGSALVLILALAVAVAVLVTALFVITGVFAGWLLWIVFGWLFLARRRRAMWLHSGGVWPPRGGRRLSA